MVLHLLFLFCPAPPPFVFVVPCLRVRASPTKGLAVDEDALCSALTSGSITGAALDVYKTEPLPEESPLWECENLLITSHNADYTSDYFELGWRVWRENFEKFKAGEPLVTPVDVHSGY
jgi:phosphoglycerate dehydrogenase-like enzyme